MALDGVTSFLSRGFSFIGAQREAKQKKKWQEYNNAMIRLSDAQNQNTITTNKNLTMQRDMYQEFSIERTEYTTIAQAEVAAAATDTAGNSVNQTIYDIERNAAMQQQNRRKDLEAQLISYDEQRRQSAFSAALQIDNTPIVSPNPATYMLGFANDMLSSYKKNYPNGFSRGTGSASSGAGGKVFSMYQAYDQ